MRFKEAHVLFIVLAIFFLSAFFNANAQVPGQTSVSIRVREAYVSPGNEAKPTWLVNGQCVFRNGIGWMYFDQPVGSVFGSANQTFSVSLQSWTEDCHNRCSYESNCGFLGNDSDNARTFGSASFALSSFAPGVYNSIPEVMYGGFGVRLTVSYSTPVPEKPEIVVSDNIYTGSNLCNTQEIKLRPAIQVNPVFNDQINYSWEYHVEGDNIQEERERCLFWNTEEGFTYCEEYETYYVDVPVWRSLGNTNAAISGGETSIALSSLEGLQNIITNKQVYFRVKATANGSVSSNSPISNIVNVNPSAPTSTPPSSLPSCSTSNTGKVIVQNVVTGYSTARYILKSGANATLGCDPELTANCLSINDYSGLITNFGYHEITEVRPGDYTLFLLNNAGVEGFCPSQGTTISVGMSPLLALGSVQGIDIACNATNSGAVLYTVNQGNTSGITHSLTNLSTGQSWGQTTYSIGGVGFGSLSPGQYQVIVDDHCSNPVVIQDENLAITQPAKVELTQLVAGRASCYAPVGTGDGEVQVEVHKSSTGEITSSQYHYQLFNNGSLYNQIISTESRFTWSNLPVGNNYTVIVMEPGAAACNSWSGNLVVPGPAPLSISNIQSVSTSCNGFSDGALTFEGNGGIGLYNFELTPPAGPSILNTDGTFDELNAGNYQLLLRSALTGCTDYYVYPTLVAVDQPTPISILTNKTDITCLGRTDGTITATVSGSTPGYNYLWEVNTGTGWEYLGYSVANVTDLEEATYRLLVTDINSCVATSPEVIIQNPEPTLLIQNIQPVPATCYGVADGSITFDGSGGTGSYIYELTPEGGSIQQNGTGVFTGLLEGQYWLRLRNAPAGCIDYYVHPLSVGVGHSSDISIVLTKNNVTCAGANNGSLLASVLGGTPGYTFEWEKYTGLAWSLQSAVTDAATNLSSGRYRVIARDAIGCRALSTEETITEPLKLELTSGRIHDIKCIAAGETGSIEPIAIGGTEPYTFEYSIVNTPFVEFTSTTPLNPGEYYIRVKDGNGCISLPRPTPFFITLPPRILNFSYTLSNYNGFEVSCYRGDNGSVEISAAGGNGAPTYGNEYFYTINDKPFSSIKKIEQLTAGTYTIRVKDMRNCVVSKEITLREASSSVEGILQDKRDVICAGDKTGILEVEAKGGESPYAYNIAGLPSQTSGRFTGLGIGRYTIEIRDKNNCLSTYNDLIATFNAPVELKTEIKDVSCFEGANGSIEVQASGGTPPINYNWRELNKTTTSVSSLKAGVYTIEVKDAAGCTKEASILIKQPPTSLRLEVRPQPACYGTPGGQIAVTAQGGTSPYQYSIDGRNFQSNSIFYALPTGEYTVSTMDYNGCQLESKSEIIPRNDKPAPNFLISTKRYASDTLVAKEISVPKPDSVEWKYDPHTILINDNAWSPELMFREAGTYVMGMKGYFGGCDYEITKVLNINPFDPEVRIQQLPDHPVIMEMDVAPNPIVSGEFMLNIKLSGKQNVYVTVMDVRGTPHFKNNWEKVKELKQRIELNNVASGMYVIQVITQTEAKEMRVMVNR